MDINNRLNEPIRDRFEYYIQKLSGMIDNLPSKDEMDRFINQITNELGDDRERVSAWILSYEKDKNEEVEQNEKAIRSQYQIEIEKLTKQIAISDNNTQRMSKDIASYKANADKLRAINQQLEDKIHNQDLQIRQLTAVNQSFTEFIHKATQAIQNTLDMMRIHSRP